MKKRKGQAEGYDFRTNEDGIREAVSQRTGEITTAATVEVPAGSFVITPDQQQERREALERERARYFSSIGKNKANEFYFITSQERFENISKANAARMVYLCTYLSYDGRLKISERMPMKKGDIADILEITRQYADRFWDEVTAAGYLSQDGDGALIPDKTKIKRGHVRNEWFQKIYITGVRSLYHSVDKSQLKLVGSLFSLLPYVNIEYNVLCYNTEEKDFNAVELMRLSQYCREIGFDVHNIGRKVGDMRRILFDVDGHKERFYSIVGDGRDLANSFLFINPNILYSGTQFDRVCNLGKFCEVDNR